MSDFTELWNNDKGVIENMVNLRDLYMTAYQQTPSYDLALAIGSISSLISRMDYRLMVSKIENERREFHGEERTR